jgi:hypothetical protein
MPVNASSGAAAGLPDLVGEQSQLRRRLLRDGSLPLVSHYSPRTY